MPLKWKCEGFHWPCQLKGKNISVCFMESYEKKIFPKEE